MLSKLFRHNRECRHASPSIFYPLFFVLFGVTASLEVSASITFKSISAGDFHTCGVKPDGAVLCWGRDNYGQATPPNSTFTQVSAGLYHTCGITTDESVACWGINNSGQALPPNGSFTQVNVAKYHSCGVKIDGSVVCWGFENMVGQDSFHEGDNKGQASPPSGTFTQVSASDLRTCGLKTDGNVTCWGYDDEQFSPPRGTFTQVSTGNSHTCGIKSDGNIACWGYNNFGQSNPPSGTFTQVSAAKFYRSHLYSYSCGVKTDGSVSCWGDNEGRHGQATPPDGAFTQVSVSGEHTCGVKTDGSVVCWGDDGFGQATPPTVDIVTEPIQTFQPQSFQGNTGDIKAIAFSPDGRYILAGGSGLALWSVHSSQAIRTFGDYTLINPIYSVAFSPDGSRALSGGRGVILWDVQSGQEIRSFGTPDNRHTDHVLSVAFSPDGRYVLTGSEDKTMKLWEVQTGQHVRTFQDTSIIHSVAFSPNGHHILSSSDSNHTLKLWNVQSGQEVKSFQGHINSVYSVAFSPDGQYILSGGYDGYTGFEYLTRDANSVLKLWDVQSGQEVRSFQFPKPTWITTQGQSIHYIIYSVAFSPDGRYGLSSGGGLWDINTGKELRTFQVPSGTSKPKAGAIFSPDGQYVVTGTHSGVKLWKSGIPNTSANKPPIAAFIFSPSSGLAPLIVSLDASTSTDDGIIKHYHWSSSDGQTFSGTISTTTMAFQQPGTYTISLLVTDDADRTSTPATAQVTVNEIPKKPPIANMRIFPIRGESPLIISLDANGSSDPDGSIVSYEWSINGQILQGIMASFTLTAAAEYPIVLTVTDNEGLTTTVQQSVSVSSHNRVPNQKEPSPPQNDGTHTLILTNRMKLTQFYGPIKANQLMSKLNELANHPDVQGLVIQVEDDLMVANAYAARGNNYDNKNQANVVVTIKQFIRRHWDALGNQLKNIMLIGDDRVIPFYRIKDGTFEPDPWTLTDDFYTDRNPTECPTCANPLVFIPDVAGGRLIETPAQIIGMIDAFLADNNINIRSAAVTGYDFVQDGAKAACDTLQRVDIPSDCSLMGEFWGSEDFKGQILNRHHDITSINGHANYEMFLTPDDRNIWTSDIANTRTDFAGTLFYTVGCHSGLNVADKLDLPESLAIKQANYIANTGYGIGGLDGIELSEELMWNLTKELVKSQTTLGKALLNAKQQYFADNPNFGPFDEKIVAESTLYGLPMYQVTSQATAKLSPAITAITTQTTQEQGLRKAGYSYTWATATPIATTSGKKFYALNRAITSSSEGKPILPKLSYNVTQTQKALHGVVFRGGSYNTVNVTPPIQRFKTTTGHITPERTFNAPGWYPSIFFTPNTVPLDIEAKETLVATAGQYNPNLTTGQQRIFSNMDFDVFHHVNTNDWTKPTVYLMENRLNANIATVTIATSDASGIKEVVLAYTDGNGTWNSTNLTGSDVTWTGSFAANANTEFFIQAIDKAGNVAVNENEGKYFKVGQTPINLTTDRLTAHLTNISTRAAILGGANDVIAGFIITGSGTQKIIIRALSLEAGVDPKLTVHQYPSGELLASNDNWQSDPRVAEIPAHLVLPNPIDAGVLLDLSVGAYTAILSSEGAKGLGLISVDEVEPNGTTKLTNISTRASIQGGANDVIAGFIITGSGSQKVMIRGLALEAGVNPKLTLQKYPSGEPVASNDNWQTDSRASEIPEHMKLQSPTDAGLLLDLPVGAYTAILSSVGANGLGLIGVDAINDLFRQKENKQYDNSNSTRPF